MFTGAQHHTGMSFNRNMGGMAIGPAGITRPHPAFKIGPDLPSAAADQVTGAMPPDKAAVPRGKEKGILRYVAGDYYEDKTLDEWPENDFRVFCGDLGNEVTDDLLANAFRKFKSFQKAKVIRDKRTGKTKGYGFVSFANPEDMVLALKEVNGK